MSKKNESYESTLWYRLKYWVDGEEKEDAIEQENEKHEENLKRVAVEDRVYRAFLEIPDDGKEEDAYHRSLRKEVYVLSEKYKYWPEEKGLRIFEYFYRISAIIFCLLLIGILLLTVSYLPQFGNPNNPANNEVSKRYLEKGVEETGAINLVTGMILDYRAFDTLGESHVLFISVCSVLLLLRQDKKIQEKTIEKAENIQNIILEKISFLLVPIILLFGIYVVLNGHLSPGGGFSGGAIIGAGLILFDASNGNKSSTPFFTEKTFRSISLFALSCYSIAKGYSFYMGANHLDSGIPIGNAGDICSGGLILILNICVGMVVACTMYAFYNLFRKGGI